MKHGGKRMGAGRPKGMTQYKESTKPIRLPIILIDPVLEFVKHQVISQSKASILEKFLNSSLQVWGKKCIDYFNTQTGYVSVNQSSGFVVTIYLGGNAYSFWKLSRNDWQANLILIIRLIARLAILIETLLILSVLMHFR